MRMSPTWIWPRSRGRMRKRRSSRSIVSWARPAGPPPPASLVRARDRVGLGSSEKLMRPSIATAPPVIASACLVSSPR